MVDSADSVSCVVVCVANCKGEEGGGATMTKKYVDAVTGEVLDEKPDIFDFVSSQSIIRIVPALRLIEVAVAVDGETFKRIANMTAGWNGIERPSDRIIFRSHKGFRVNAFIDYDPEAEEFDHYVLAPEDLPEVLADPRRKVVIPVTPGTLSEHGYATDMSAVARRQVLRKIIEGGYEKAISVYRHLIARATQHKRRNPDVVKVLRSDAEWVKKIYYGTRFWR